jgi:uncharacterized protein (TIGR02217 family)
MEILFNEIRLPTDIAYGAVGGPEFFTDVVTTSNGVEHRNINWNLPRNRYNLAPAIKTKEQLESLLNFFRLCKGKAIAFRFKDWADFTIAKQQIAMADGKTQNFQLVKIYKIGEVKIVRKITKPVKETIKIFINDSLADFSINHLGVVSFTEPPDEGDIIKAAGEFDVPVRFDTDYLATTLENYGAYSHQEIPLIEVKYA